MDLSPRGKETLKKIAVPIALGLTYAEIASQLSVLTPTGTRPCTVNHVSRRMQQLREELRAQVERDGRSVGDETGTKSGRDANPDGPETHALAGQTGMAPGGVEPPHADSKSAALSAELRGRVLECSPGYFKPWPGH